MNKIEKVNEILKIVGTILMGSSFFMALFQINGSIALVNVGAFTLIMYYVLKVEEIIYIEEEFKRNEILTKIENFLEKEKIFKDFETIIENKIIKIVPKKFYINNYLEIKFKEDVVTIKTSSRIRKLLHRDFRKDEKDVVK